MKKNYLTFVKTKKYAWINKEKLQKQTNKQTKNLNGKKETWSSNKQHFCWPLKTH